MIKWVYQLFCRHHIETEVWSFNHWTGEDQIESMCMDCDRIRIRKIVRRGHAPEPYPRQPGDHWSDHHGS